jgi:hypothetical protein
MAKQRKPAAPSLGAEIAQATAPVAPVAPVAPAATVLYVVSAKGFKPRTDHGYGGKGRNPQATAWGAVCAALPADHGTLVAIVRQVAQADGTLVAHGPGYPANFVNKRIRNGALVPQA